MAVGESGRVSIEDGFSICSSCAVWNVREVEESGLLGLSLLLQV